MCRGCFNQLFLRDEFYSGGMAGLLGKAAGMPTRRAFMAYSVASASALTGVGASPVFAADQGADRILRGGTIRPLPGAPVVSAIAVKGGKVNGDYAVDIALDAIESAYAGSTDFGVNRIEHSTMARPDQIVRMTTLNVQPSFLMNHVRFYGAAYRDQIFGSERAAFMDPAGACVKAGLPFTMHTDAPCSPPGSESGSRELRATSSPHRQILGSSEKTLCRHQKPATKRRRRRTSVGHAGARWGRCARATWRPSCSAPLVWWHWWPSFAKVRGSKWRLSPR
jgi:Amidohydrolase family